ncbi:hypothetical protein B1A75_13075 [Geobacillus sp. LEMMY01]|nr:hypothetical protein B1A75_13075 [Geobacillus sp. LEMMY01]
MDQQCDEGKPVACLQQSENIDDTILGQREVKPASCIYADKRLAGAVQRFVGWKTQKTLLSRAKKGFWGMFYPQ